MRLLILSRSRMLYSTQRLVEEARHRELECIVINPMLCELSLKKDKPQVAVRNHILPKFDVVVPRIGSSIFEFGLLVVRQFESLGATILNSSEAIYRSRNKFRSLQYLAEHGVPVPRTFIAKSLQSFEDAVAALGGYPVIIKFLQGTQGIGVMIAHDRSIMESVISTALALERDILVQEYVKESKGQDVRVFVVGGKVAGAMRRVAPDGEFRANIHRGGRGDPVHRLKKSYETMAVKAAKIMGLDIAGVDFLETASGPTVIEVNNSPGFNELEQSTGLNIAGKIIELAKKRA